MMVAAIDTEAGFTPATTPVHFEGQYLDRSSRQHDVALDSQRLLMIAGAEAIDYPAAEPQIIRVESWFEELTRLAHS